MGVGCESISPTFLKLGGGVSRTQGLRGRGLCRHDFQVQGGFPGMTLPSRSLDSALNGPQGTTGGARRGTWGPLAASGLTQLWLLPHHVFLVRL